MVRPLRVLPVLLAVAAPLQAQGTRWTVRRLLPAAGSVVAAGAAPLVSAPALSPLLLTQPALLAAPSLRAEIGLAPMTGAIGESVPTARSVDRGDPEGSTRPRIFGGYVRRAAGKELLEFLRQAVSDAHEPLSEAGAIRRLFSDVDNRPRGEIRGVRDGYGGVFVPGTGEYAGDYAVWGDPAADGSSGRQTLAVEHIFPLFFFGRKRPMRSDLHALMAVLKTPNRARDRLPFGQAEGSSRYRNSVGARSDGRVFEPPDFSKGPVARAMLYFYVRYGGEAFFKEERVASFWNSQLKTLLEWNRREPTDEERERNDAAQVAQGNRNPFVDDPRLADRIGSAGFRAVASAASVARSAREDLRRQSNPAPPPPTQRAPKAAPSRRKGRGALRRAQGEARAERSSKGTKKRPAPASARAAATRVKTASPTPTRPAERPPRKQKLPRKLKKRLTRSESNK